MVAKVLSAKNASTGSAPNPQVDTSHWEQEIDGLVYGLYELSEYEIEIIEGK